MEFVARPESEPKTPLAERIRLVRKSCGNLERDEFSSLIGVSKNTLAYYERGERTPDAKVLEAYRDRFGVNLNWLVSGEDEMFHTQRARLQAQPMGNTTTSTQAAFAFLPFYEDVEAAAGSGAAVISDAAHSVIGFARDLLRESGASPQNCTVIRAKGDSMSPTIPDGALLVVDHSQRDIANGFITVIGVGDDLLVKRVRRRLDGLIDLISDNPAYASETLGPGVLQQLRVIGRVVYFCRTP